MGFVMLRLYWHLNSKRLRVVVAMTDRFLRVESRGSSLESEEVAKVSEYDSRAQYPNGGDRGIDSGGRYSPRSSPRAARTGTVEGTSKDNSKERKRDSSRERDKGREMRYDRQGISIRLGGSRDSSYERYGSRDSSKERYRSRESPREVKDKWSRYSNNGMHRDHSRAEISEGAKKVAGPISIIEKVSSLLAEVSRDGMLSRIQYERRLVENEREDKEVQKMLKMARLKAKPDAAVEDLENAEAFKVTIEQWAEVQRRIVDSRPARDAGSNRF
ncbi:arginine/serine-rich coiled-coil protein 2-like [Watersipora subatra]|uniref:arginine/serine-rich coiled-coil protein 2-like n=1 Tax=Watersipora subatra TaxID=2589382 RepID=UPI00355B0E0F